MKVKKIDNQGRGIVYDSSKIGFIENALIDEDITYDIIMDKKKYFIGRSTSIKNTNKQREDVKCPYYNSCGGCNIMHMNKDLKNNFKKDKIKEILLKYSSLNVDPIFIENNKDLNYRNKVTLKIKDYSWGFYNSNTHEFTSVDNCLLVENPIINIINSKKYHIIPNGEIIIRTNYKGDVLLIINTKDDIKFDNIDDFIVGIVINNKTLYGVNYLIDKIGNMNFKFSYNSFFQINRYMNEQIFKIINKYLKGNNLIDLYCGVGTLGLSVANNFNHVYGIEKISNAIHDAKYNSKINNINNTSFYAGDTADVLKKLNIDFDSLIIDPPRSGLNKETINIIEQNMPNTVLYVSCDPMTLARDLKTLNSLYSVKKIFVLDMFPNTYHVECVCVLCLKENQKT